MVDCTSTAVSLFPNAIIPLGRIGFPINMFWPIDKNTTRLDWIYYALPPDGEDRFDPAALPEHWKYRRGVYNQIMAEDERNMAPMQRSMESPALRGMPALSRHLPGSWPRATPTWISPKAGLWR
jgi:hypothetical protein